MILWLEILKGNKEVMIWRHLLKGLPRAKTLPIYNIFCLAEGYWAGCRGFRRIGYTLIGLTLKQRTSQIPSA
jgi:hypothetical protein